LFEKLSAKYQYEEIERKIKPGQLYEFTASITLILDGSKSIIVDTGLGTESDIRKLIKRGCLQLNKFGIKPSDVSYVVTTHGHPDHSGNTNDFVKATHYTSVFQHQNNRFKLSALFEVMLTTNVYLQKTPGHTPEDISVIVKNTKDYNTVFISGDVFMRKEDVTYPMMWKPLSNNVTEQTESRRKLLCLANSIVPGHGPMFTVTEEMRIKAGCGK
uniref:Metallo-beta-lactamase domain-containing protein 1 n=1 Tax=Enterobius vermicularis TaxID=51028 RepID=A0A0N4V700_ENTVE